MYYSFSETIDNESLCKILLPYRSETLRWSTLIVSFNNVCCGNAIKNVAWMRSSLYNSSLRWCVTPYGIQFWGVRFFQFWQGIPVYSFKSSVMSIWPCVQQRNYMTEYLKWSINMTKSSSFQRYIFVQLIESWQEKIYVLPEQERSTIAETGSFSHRWPNHKQKTSQTINCPKTKIVTM